MQRVQGKPDDARLSLLRALRLDPKLLPARFGLGGPHLLRKEYAQAAETPQRALAGAGPFPEAAGTRPGPPRGGKAVPGHHTPMPAPSASSRQALSGAERG